MIRRFTVFVSFVAIIAAGLFFRQLLDALRGMTVLEALQQIVGFVLHVVVVSIVGYGVYTVVELVEPLVKTFRRKQRQARRQIRGRRSASAPVHRSPAAPRRRDLMGLLLMMSQMAKEYQSRQQTPAPKSRIRF